MSDLRLALRVLRGGGAAGLVRLGLMTVGFGLGLTIVLFLATMPTVLDERGRVTAARQPLSANKGTPAAFDVHPSFGSWHGSRFTRVLVTVADPAAATPPGVARLPRPGEVVLSPAAAALAAQDPQFARLVPGRVVGEVGPPGLLGPDELYAYLGVEHEALGPATPSRGWGGFSSDQEVGQQFADVPLQLLLIVAAPAVIYFTVCARLSAATRSRRYAALRLIGMSQRRVRRIAVCESAAAGLPGALLGLLGYYLGNQVIGPSGVLGFSWYPQVSALPPTLAVVICLGAVAAAGLIGGASTSRALRRPLETRLDGGDRPARWWYAAPFMLGLGLVLFPVLAGDSPHRVLDPFSGGLLIVGVVLTTVGLLLALRPLLLGLARWVATSGVPLSMRIAARRVETESAGLSWHLAGLCVLVLVGTVGAGVQRQTELSATPGSDAIAVRLTGEDIPAAARPRLATLPAALHWYEQPSVTERPTAGAAPRTVEDYVRLAGVRLIFANCATLRQISGATLPTCQDGQAYRIGQTSQGEPLPAGLPVPFQRDDGGLAALPAPAGRLDLPAGGFTVGLGIVITEPDPRGGVTSETRIFYSLPSGIEQLDRFAVALAEIAPAAGMTVSDLDLTALESFRVHRGVLGIGTLLAFLLGIAAFAVSTVGRAVERRREVAALVVVGVPRRTVRAVQWWQMLAPLALALLVATAVGHLAGNAVLKLQGQQLGWYTGTLAAAWPMVAAGLTTAALLGSLVFGLRPRAEELRRE